MAPRLKALVLAAGLSSRMGALKALLPLGPHTVLEQCLDVLRTAGVAAPIVVTGHRAEEVAALASRAGALPIHNPEFASGMFSSIRTGAAHLAGPCDGFFLLPVDLPLIKAATLLRLIRTLVETPARILHPVFAGRRGHPPLLSGELLPAILAHHDHPGGLRSLLARVEAETPDQVREVQVADGGIHLDLDTPEEYQAAQLRFVRRDIPTLAECEAIVDHIHPLPARGGAHGRRVAAVAMALCRAVNQGGGRTLDVELCRVGGWLHDLAKGQPGHEAEGARWLRDLGFDRVAAIVAAHKDLDWAPSLPLGEREIVHLADKLVRGSRLVSLDARFGEKLAAFAHDPLALEAIRTRRAVAQQLAKAVAREAGQSLAQILDLAGEPCST